MPNQAEAVAGVRFKIHDVPATVKARRILDELAIEKEITESKRRQRMHTSMLDYTEHARNIRNKGLLRSKRKSHTGLVTHPIMQFDNKLALSGGLPYTIPTGRLKHLTTTATNSATSVDNNSFENSKVTEGGKIRRIAILKSNNEIVYGNYNNSGSIKAGGVPSDETVADSESILPLNNATGRETIIQGKPNHGKAVGAKYIRLHKPDEFHSGILPRPGQGGKRKVTPRFTLDITLPRMETDDRVCVTPHVCVEDSIHDDKRLDVHIEIADKIEQDTTESDLNVDNGAKMKSMSSAADGTNETSVQYYDNNAQSRNVSRTDVETTSVPVKKVNETDLNKSKSTDNELVSSDQRGCYTHSLPASFRSNVKTKDGQIRRYNVHRYQSDITTRNNIRVSQNVRMDHDMSSQSCHVPIVAGDISTSLNSQNKLTLRSILKPVTTTSSTGPVLKKEASLKVWKDQQVKDTKHVISNSEINLPGELTNNQLSMSYHKAYTVNIKSLPSHMKVILENAMESSKRIASKVPTRNERAIRSEDHGKIRNNPRNSGNVCRHGIFADSCSICVALGHIQQRIKYNIKKHVSDTSQWNLFPRQKQSNTKWLSSVSTSHCCSSSETNHVHLPNLNSTITVSDLRRIRRKKRREIKQAHEQDIHTDQVQTSVQTILFDNEDNLCTQKSSNGQINGHKNTKSVRFAEDHIYRQMIGYGAK